jgi:hypothetical protein
MMGLRSFSIDRCCGSLFLGVWVYEEETKMVYVNFFNRMSSEVANRALVAANCRGGTGVVVFFSSLNNFLFTVAVVRTGADYMQRFPIF